MPNVTGNVWSGGRDSQTIVHGDTETLNLLTTPSVGANPNGERVILRSGAETDRNAEAFFLGGGQR